MTIPSCSWNVARVADDKRIRGPADRGRINLEAAHEIQYWMEALGVTRDQLVACVEKVGVKVTDVKRCLGR